MRALCLSAVLGLLTLGAGCSNPPSSDQCQRLRDHLLELQLKEAGHAPLTPEQEAEFAAYAKRVKYNTVCTERATRALVECALAATSTDEARACDEKAKAKKPAPGSDSGSGSGS